jgi:hypothetical protein
MNKIEQAGIDTKNKVLSDVLEKTRNSDFNPSFCIVRGSAYKSVEDHVFSISNSTEATIALKAFVDACKNHKDSRHQVDYIVASFVGDASVTKLKVPNKTSENELDQMAKKGMSDQKEKSSEKTLIVFIMSENEIEFSSYGIIESSGKSNASAVISPSPIIYSKGPYFESRFYSSESKMPNFFDISVSERAKIHVAELNYKDMFAEDSLHFPPKDNVSPVNNEKKKITKFGY